MNNIDSMMEVVLKAAGPVLFLALQLSSLITVYRIHSVKSVGKLSSLPFFSLFVNCYIWTLYGFLKTDNTIMLPNVSGFMVSIICIVVYRRYSEEFSWLFYGVSFIIILISSVLTAHGEANLLGSLGCVLSIIVSGSPLAVVKTVINEKSTISMPFFTSFIMWLNNFSWLSYGIMIANDPLIYLPNLLGFSLSTVQMILFVVYGFPVKKYVDMQAANKFFGNEYNV
eukprot:gene7884-10700_t